MRKEIDYRRIKSEFHDRKRWNNMTCNYFEYREMTDKLFYGVALTDSHLDNATEKIQNYFVYGGAENILKQLKIGIRVITMKTTLPSTEIIRRRFVYLDDRHKGEELTIREIENIGMFLKHGAMYRMYDSNTL